MILNHCVEFQISTPYRFWALAFRRTRGRTDSRTDATSPILHLTWSWTGQIWRQNYVKNWRQNYVKNGRWFETGKSDVDLIMDVFLRPSKSDANLRLDVYLILMEMDVNLSIVDVDLRIGRRFESGRWFESYISICMFEGHGEFFVFILQ